MTTYKNTRWQMYRSKKYVKIDLSPMPTAGGDPRLYRYADMPAEDDTGWQDAPTNDKGQLNFDQESILPGGFREGCLKHVDFTYFRTYVNIPEDTEISQFDVTINQVDDGARMYLYNKNYKGGVYKAADDAKLAGSKVRADFTYEAAPGWNMVLIVQFDDCPVRNRLTGGVEIKLNNQSVVTDPQLTPPQVKLTAGHYRGQEVILKFELVNDIVSVSVNDEEIISRRHQDPLPVTRSLTSRLRKGYNEIRVRAQNTHGWGRLKGKLMVGDKVLSEWTGEDKHETSKQGWFIDDTIPLPY